MLPIILGVSVSVGAGAFLWLIDVLMTNKSPSEFRQEDIIDDSAKFFKKSEETKAKRHATRIINKLIKKIDNHKLGKSDSPKDRNAQHIEFGKMYILVESDNECFIKKLEEIYNERYIFNSKNKNYKIGSAGEMIGETGRYFLYFVANRINIL